MPVTERYFNEQMDRLLDTLAAGRPKAVYAGLLDEFAELVGTLEWVTDRLFRAAVTTWLAQRDGVPTPHQFLAFLQDQAAAERRANVKALPPPEPLRSARPSNATLLRHIAIGKLRARSGRLLNSGDPGAHEFSEGEVQAVVDDMAARREFEALRRLQDEAPAAAVLAAVGVPAVAWPEPQPAPAGGEWPS